MQLLGEDEELVPSSRATLRLCPDYDKIPQSQQHREKLRCVSHLLA